MNEKLQELLTAYAETNQKLGRAAPDGYLNSLDAERLHAQACQIRQEIDQLLKESPLDYGT